MENKSVNIYKQDPGYTIQSEDDLHIKNLRVNIRCADYYKGEAKVTTCENDQEDYILSGCEPDPEHPFNCTEKCGEEDLTSGKCKSSFVPFNNSEAKGNCKDLLINGETCKATCSLGYTPTETKCYKGKIIRGVCEKLKKNNTKGISLGKKDSTNISIGDGEKMRSDIMEKQAQMYLGKA